MLFAGFQTSLAPYLIQARSVLQTISGLDLDLPDKRHSESIFTNQPQYSLTPSRENIRTSNRPHNAKKGVTHTAQKSIKRKLCLLKINCQSIVNIKDQPRVMLDNIKPDIVGGTESWLRPDIKDNEIFPSDYTVYRCDRKTSKGGGVFIATSECFLSESKIVLETDCEMVWVKLCVTGCKDLYIYSYYRPNVSEEVIPELLNESLNWISHNNCHLWLAGN